MHPFDLDANESQLFSHWSYNAYYTLLVNNTGLPSGYRFANADPKSTYNIAKLPAPYQIAETRIPGLFYAWYASPYSLTQTQVEADMTAIISRLQSTMNSTATISPEFVQFRSHTPFKLEVSADAISQGFYKQLEGRKW